MAGIYSTREINKPNWSKFAVARREMLFFGYRMLSID